jgi:DNA invertase Pin-like site-specific DNA recombinase
VTYQDLGLSGFRGENARTGDLAVFLEAIELGKVKRGSILIIEALDRLTRDDIDEALELFLGIVRKGVDVATFDPQRVYTLPDIKKNPMMLFEPILIMVRGNEESSRKSGHSKTNWAKKIAKAKEKVITRNIPGWLTVTEEGKFRTIPERVKSVKMLFSLAIDGLGVITITKQLNAMRMPTIGTAKVWDQSTVRRILRSRHVLGEYQPMTRCGKWARRPCGKPIIGYYPVIVSESTWCRVQQGMDARVRQSGPSGRHGPTNLFTGLVSYSDGSHMVVKSRTDQRPKQMVSAMAFRGKGSKYITFRYDVFEKCFLRVLSDLKAEDIQPAQLDDQQTELQAAEGRLADLEYRIEKIRTRLATDPDLDSLMDDIAKMQRERKTVAKEVERLKAESHSGGQVQTWRETVHISDLLATTTGEELIALRRRLKARIHDLVKAVVIRVERNGWFGRIMTGKVLLASGVERGFKIRHEKFETQYSILDNLENLRKGKKPSRVESHRLRTKK